MDRLMVDVLEFTGTSSSIEILPQNFTRSYLAFYVSGATGYITLGDNTFEIQLGVGTFWEPGVAFTNLIKLKGVGSTLKVLTSGDYVANYALTYKTYDLTYGTYGLTY